MTNEHTERIKDHAVAKSPDHRTRIMLLVLSVAAALSMLMAFGAGWLAVKDAEDEALDAQRVTEQLRRLCDSDQQVRYENRNLCESAEKIADGAEIQDKEIDDEDPNDPDPIDDADPDDPERNDADPDDPERDEAEVQEREIQEREIQEAPIPGPPGPPPACSTPTAENPNGCEGAKGETGEQGPPGPPGPAGQSCPDGWHFEELTVVTPQGGTRQVQACVQ